MTDVREARRSAIEASACLYRYDQIWNRGVVDQSNEARRGVVFHSAAEIYIGKLAGVPGLTADFDLAKEAFVDAVEMHLLAGQLHEEVRFLFLRKFAERFELNRRLYLHVERQLLTPFGDRVFKWKPDLVYAGDDGMTIIDWKTHWIAWTPDQARREFQSKFYLLAARKEWPNQPAYRMRYVFVRAGLAVDVSYSPTELDTIEEEVDAVLATIDAADRAGEYPATSGPHCSFCRLDCPINGAGSLYPFRVDTAETFDRIAAEYLALNQRLTLMRKALKSYAVTEGARVVNGMTFAHWPRTTTRYPVDSVLAIAEKHRIEIPDLTISESALGPLTNERAYPTVAAEIQEVARPRRSYVFEARKGGEVTLPDMPRPDEGIDDGDE